jgi:hypothetical protein
MSLKLKLPIWVFIAVTTIGVAAIILLIQYKSSVFDEMKLQSIEDAYWTKMIPQKVAGWKTYRNNELGIEFKYPNNWPSPVFYRVDSDDVSLFPIRWRLNIGFIEKGGCEGSDCYTFYYDGLQKSAEETIETMNNEAKKEDAFLGIISRGYINNNQVITYWEGGACASRNAFIFDANQSIIFTARCSEDSPELIKIFDQILSTIKFVD